MKFLVKILILAILETIGYFIYKNLNVEEIWKYVFAYIYGGIAMTIYLGLQIDFKNF